MSPHNAHRHLQKKPSVCAPPKKRSRARMITFFSLCVGVLGLMALLPSVAMAVNTQLSITANVGVTEAPGAQIQFTVSAVPQLSSGHTIDVDFSTVPGTAVVPDDYATNSGHLTFTSMAWQDKTITIDIADDAMKEGIEQFTVTLFNITSDPGTTVIPVNLIGTATITDDDYEVAVFANQSVEENSGPMSFTVTLDRQVTGVPVSIDYTLAGIDATAGTDFDATPGTLNFGVGDDSKQIDVTIQPDADKEDDETFTVTLTQTSGNVTIVDDEATGTIRNDDYVITSISGL